jgi:hypothetical protein
MNNPKPLPVSDFVANFVNNLGIMYCIHYMLTNILYCDQFKKGAHQEFVNTID